MRKKGSLPVIVLVVLTLLLTLFTLFIFQTTPSKFQSGFVSMGLLEDVYVKENIVRYQIYIVGKNLSNHGLLTEEKFREDFLKFEFTEDYLVNLKSFVAQKKFKISNGVFELIDPEKKYVISSKAQTVSIDYYSDLKVDLK